MEFLDFSDIIEAHKRMVQQFGGLYGIRDASLAESAIMFPQLAYSIGEIDDVHMLAAFYGYHLIKNHPFIDGNKRIGAFAMVTFLRLNDFIVTLSNKELADLAINIATSQLSEKEVQAILKKNSHISRSSCDSPS